ncbi:hypothetical protein P154DRAFT_445465, partial [Amniculicola lignicola CBS 123094]
SSLVSSAASVIESDLSTIVPTSTVPAPSLPNESDVSSLLSSIESDLSTPTVVPSSVSSSILSSGFTGSGTDVTGSTAVPTASGNSTGVESPSASDLPVSTAEVPLSSITPSPSSDTPTLIFTPPPQVTSKPKPVPSISATGTNSDTMLYPGTSIIQEPSTVQSPTGSPSGIPSGLPEMIAPPSGLPTPPDGYFLGQIGFKWQLNFPFVSRKDGGNQIFTYLPIAISDALNISLSDVYMNGLKPFDTTQYQGFVTTLALFWIPPDLANSLAAQLRNPPDPFWHNKNQTVNDLTSLINTAFPLAAGKLPGDGDKTQTQRPEALTTGGAQGGGAIGGDIGTSKKVNPTSVGVAAGAVVGALAYGAAMIFVARRYRNRRVSHQRSSSVPSTSRFTYGSMNGGGAAFMSGGRGGRSTPGGRDSRGSSSSNGRSIRTQQISAPVMAENSLGWN